MKKMMVFSFILISSLSVYSDNKLIKLDGIKIKADNEAPQVMHVIPWLNPEGAERLYTPVKSAKVERLKPLDPYTFELELALHQEWMDATKELRN